MQISIIGCGWLGLPLGEHLAARGYTILGSTTSTSKMDKLKKSGISPYLFKLIPMPSGQDFNTLFKSDLLFINIPPGRRKSGGIPNFYEEQIKYLHYLINQHKVARVIFVSSTSYYPNTKDWVNTQTDYDFASGSNRAVVQGEKQICKVSSELLILRCGGLMGGERIPGRWFAGKPTTGADNPVNYIHRTDVIGIVEQLISQNSWDKPIMNLVGPEHPSRQQVHEAMANKYGFEKPIWSDPAVTDHKLVRSDIEQFPLQYPSPLGY